MHVMFRCCTSVVVFVCFVWQRLAGPQLDQLGQVLVGVAGDRVAGKDLRGLLDGLSGGTKRATSVNMPLLHLQSSERNSQCLAKSSLYGGPSAGAEVARLRKWLVRWRLGLDLAGAHDLVVLELLGHHLALAVGVGQGLLVLGLGLRGHLGGAPACPFM